MIISPDALPDTSKGSPAALLLSISYADINTGILYLNKFAILAQWPG